MGYRPGRINAFGSLLALISARTPRPSAKKASIPRYFQRVDVGGRNLFMKVGNLIPI
jgi:hypothetical protein